MTNSNNSQQVQNEPFELFKGWFELAKKNEMDYPESMTLATCSEDGRPHARIVLMKNFNPEGFTFYTNLNSDKAQNLEKNPFAALCFHWKTLKRQVRIEGKVNKLSDQEADEYFATRPRLSQLGAWASKQSKPMEDSLALVKAVAHYTTKFHVGKIPRPHFWSGFLLAPDRIEFWEEKPFRLHDRKVFTNENGEWMMQSLYP